ncbi:chorismate-binding protein [Barrientosiimonas endolithica]|uniref:Anthranilate synthase n=1 Tax=Barrientosiimonas endolithica TaxID=1535208 RepID=A0ABM8HAY4_9MICO|nr:chorismate-binding protein [Barrientosiimonas endolithica]BDZ58103.1 anthranilate synthase [Barrientosiimonas endolithica]
MSRARAVFGDRCASGVAEITHDPARLDAGGFWVVVATFEGELTAVRMDDVRREQVTPAPHLSEPHLSDPRLSEPHLSGPDGPDPAAAWTSSLTEADYRAGVEEIRRRISTGEVYQVNLCRVLSTQIAPETDLDLLDQAVRQGNPAPYAARIDIPEAGLDLVCASPELFLERAGDTLTSAPIKGTAPTADELLPKDRTENVMITDLVRNDLSHVAQPGTVAVDGLCALEHHPGLVHLVSTVTSRLRPDVAWTDILAATFPPGSVSGAPKSTALTAIRDLETVPRGPYCGAVGWVDADAGEARLAVGIRTFWAEHDPAGRRWLRFGTGAGITWGSDPEGEWWETALKARRLVGLARTVTEND